MRMTIINSMCVVAALMAGCAENDAPRRTASIRHSAPKPPMTDAEKARASWGATALPWLILTDKAHKVTAEGFDVDELDAKLKSLAK